MGKVIDIHEIGEIIRKLRKERGLRLEDLADSNISPATISNIERGVPHVNPEKTQYLLGKMNIETDKLPELIMGEKRALEGMEFQFLAVDSLWGAGEFQKALDKLQAINLDDPHPLAPDWYYYCGKCYLELKNWRKAERSFYKGIQLATQNSVAQRDNIEAACFLEIALCSYHQNDLVKAIQFSDSGIDAFNPEGGRTYLWPLLHRNKGVYLERLGRVAEGMKLVQEMWGLLPSMEQVDSVLGFYWLRAEFSRRMGMLEDALKYAVEGLKLARINEKYDSMFSSWTVLGGVYMARKEWDKAEEAFKTALSCEKRVTNQKRSIIMYNRLGRLYFQQGRLEEAKETIRTSIQYGENLNDAPHLVKSLLTMGEIHYSEGDREKSLLHYQRALDLARKHGYRKLENRVLYHLAQYWDEIDEKEFQNCMRNMYKAQEFLKFEEDVDHELD
ncbi:tetratricopeptide repeat protein [Salinithrix halophila]|uniref:Tetratricopeptide repeat protein n=1 Tax=Salinithrix halophila TaxID=1485204 RepID=A0ABV8JNQ5_9BACL